MDLISPSYQDLANIITEQYKKSDLNLIRKAYDFAAKAHGETKRLTGHPYITHPTAVACILARMRLGMPVITSALLHDVIEDTGVTYDEIKSQFGEEIANLVESVTKLQQARYRGTDRYLENLRKMFLAMASDVRAILIKFADRLHNLQTLYALPVPEQKRIAREALEIHAPIAGRMGMGEMRGDLEDAAFRYDNPEAYTAVQNILAEKVQEREACVKRVIEVVQEFLSQEGMPPLSIHGRIKRVYSLHRKLQRYNNDISRIYDIIAIRIIVPDGIEQCYTTLGVLHQRYKPLAGRIKDYIAQPKPNGYRSLHTTVFCEDGEIVEFQIRTKEMHEIDEYGIAAHWQYKEGGVRTTKDLHWIEELTAIKREIMTNKDFLEQLEQWKLDLFKNRIFVFTPKGDVIDLPEGATPVDFAYAIHTGLGDTCVSARINGETIKLDKPLASGDICEIIADSKRKSPSLDWLKFTKTSRARSKIKENARRTVTGWLQTILPHDKKRR